jgi:hypothetical protein
MFEGLKTWNPWFGCDHHCYSDGCWAYKRLAHRLGTLLNCKECYDFKPHYHADRLHQIPRDPRIFVVGHGDLFGDWVPQMIIRWILDECNRVPKVEWFFESKNPNRFNFYLDSFPKNTVLSATIETNRTYPVEIRGYTPTPLERFKAMLNIIQNSNIPVHFSIEPILDFDLQVMLDWMKALGPVKVAVGYDSLHNGLPEPSKEKTLELIAELERFTSVERKNFN